MINFRHVVVNATTLRSRWPLFVETMWNFYFVIDLVFHHLDLLVLMYCSLPARTPMYCQNHHEWNKKYTKLCMTCKVSTSTCTNNYSYLNLWLIEWSLWSFIYIREQYISTNVPMIHLYISSMCKRMVYGLWCLTPLSTIFQLYCGGQFHWWRKPEDPEKTTK
jgi:hypothetical protein